MLITAAVPCSSPPEACKHVGALPGPLGLEIGAGFTPRPSNLIRFWCWFWGEVTPPKRAMEGEEASRERGASLAGSHREGAGRKPPAWGWEVFLASAPKDL